jgi:predicted component of type VI protein secretion system
LLHELPAPDQDALPASTSCTALHADAGAEEPAAQERAMSAQDHLTGVKAWFDERESARNHWLKALVAATETQRQDVDVASAFVKQQLMGATEVSASAIWQWMDKLPGFTDLTPGQQRAVRVIAAFKVEDGSCWKTAVQIEAHETSMIAQPALRLQRREELLEKIKPVQQACCDLYMRASAKHANDQELILSLQDSWQARRRFTLVLTRQIRADRREVEQAATVPDESSAIVASPAETLQSLRANEVKLITLRNQASIALKIAGLAVPLDRGLLAQRQGVVDMYNKALQTTQSRIIGELEAPSMASALAADRQRAAADAQRLADLQREHAAQAQTLWGVVARLGEAQRGMSRHDNDSLDSFTEAMVQASRQDPLAWHSIEHLPGFAGLPGPVKKAAQLVAQSKICNDALRGIDVEIASLKPQAEAKV